MGEIFERVLPRQALEWTGERLTTATAGQVEIEHLHRYFLARALCRDLDVVDVASGEGYGSALLAQVARSVVGIELSDEAVEHAQGGYVAPNLRYQQGDARKLPLGDASVDVVVSFETLEHFLEHDLFIAEVQRVLRPDGFLILSSPERDVYSPLGSPANPYHVHELSRVEFEALLKGAFRNVLILLQRPLLGSTLIADDEAGISRTLTFERRGVKHYEVSHGLPRPPYNIAIASESDLPSVPNSLFIETSEIGEILSQAESGAAAHAELRSHMEQTELLVSGLRREIETASETIKAQIERAEKAEAALALAPPDSRADLAQAGSGAHAELRGHMEQSELLVSGIQTARETIKAEVEKTEAAFGLAQSASRADIKEPRSVAETAKDQQHPTGSFDGAAIEIQSASAPLAELERLRAELTQVRSELAVAGVQRDVLRTSFRHANILSESRLRQATEANELRQRNAELERKAAEWEQRYFGLRRRLEAILKRFGVLSASRLFPRPLRAFVRNRVLGPGRTQ
ncbi:methyltransferase domain-containing protein [Mesorhizobium sp. B2-5-13]|uniref:class I SAM-dependent methyltransferase n=1 Tax=unclassified Mesorhizobium TaxID=325217 RepID=UPI0011282584|nr:MULTISPECIES: class I SAM-dependent methyltransferase [unclassified Mesorhizobium]TPJ75509.1 methyltransferase domain-containing protein [Mesorhizobium sp. B2-5-13]TPK41451.1 methyltransferase domain-containing protein [Mesorhizobium sp. B2-5-5]